MNTVSYRFWLICTVLAGSVLRLSFLLDNGFPVDDGGLWYLISKELVLNKFRWPYQIEFGGAPLALLYPPLAAYLLAILRQLNFDLLQLLRWLPVLLSICAIPLVYYFSFYLSKFLAPTNDENGPPVFFALISTFIFATSFQSYHHFATGGGVPRSLGLNFQLLAWISALKFPARGKRLFIKPGDFFRTCNPLSP